MQRHPTHRVQDSTKIQSFMKCPRMYFFEYVLGWRPDEPNIHFVFGSAWHEVMEHFAIHGMAPEQIEAAFSKFEEIYRTSFSPFLDDQNGAKTPANALRALVMYAKKYARDAEEFQVLETEVAGSVLVDHYQLFFKIDTIIQDKQTGRINSLEHKTTSSFSPMWLNQWRQKFQVGAYAYALRCLYEPDAVDSIIINGACIRPEPAIKQNGEPRANARDTEFTRVPIRMSSGKVRDWITQATYWLEYIDGEFQALEACDEDEPVLHAFPKNTESCVNYGKPCPFLDFCVAKPNPLQYGDAMPVGMRREFWDPRSQQETANKVFNQERKQEDGQPEPAA